MTARPVLVGLEELRADLRQIDRDLPRQILTPVLRAAAEPALPAARREAPIGDPADYAGRARPAPGRTRQSVRMLVSQRRVAIAAGFARLPYVPPNYWGWPGHNIEPNRYLERAADSQRSQVANRAGRQLAVEMTRRGLETSS